MILRFHRRALALARAARGHHGTARLAQDHRASTKLFADAALEENNPENQVSGSNSPQELQQHKNWTGDESVGDAVLRMLVDKYKPLRTGTIRTAEEKIRQGLVLPPIHDIPHPSTSNAPASPTRASEEHQPWMTTFNPPSHASTPLVRTGRISTSPSAAKPNAAPEKSSYSALKQEKRKKEIGRLGTAKESSLDYRLGKGEARPRLNPVSVQGWANLVEDRIERARAAGQFNNIKGKGQPLPRDMAERNPFIPREELLMNRIIRRNGAAPPFVEFQGELESSVSAFRSMLREAWTRRAVRTLSLDLSPSQLARLSPAEVARTRDKRWESQEQAYHEASLNEVNALIRKYNAAAPYAVRRPYMILSVELEKCFTSATEDIVARLAEGSRQVNLTSNAEVSKPRPMKPWRLRDIIDRLFSRLYPGYPQVADGERSNK
ncbi:hypothetical protein BOTBODRAFT_65492 [Botryobasidium botryosum FD-172 SS1]|uniref:DnaJ homologue subfamily C member 28 conserved domain-containing protein n=1 Tax=Botryobasidium botryosum (strain FD-172 SS1) TaxID=930990 RepID=A0A067ML30_BOTB1|nr:hypothetical protein BOTBODRAFT_65492 [Botryobasidium botryosum FD-172 SS1]